MTRVTVWTKVTIKKSTVSRVTVESTVTRVAVETTVTGVAV